MTTPIFVLVLVMLPLAALWHRSVRSQAEDHTFARRYEASPEATYSALCGALLDLDYRITIRNPNAGEVQFKGGKLGPWIGRFGVEGAASIHKAAENESEVVITGRASLADKHGSGFLIYPEGMGVRIGRILDRVQATVVPISMLNEVRGTRSTHSAG
jgi:hypothetical protein